MLPLLIINTSGSGFSPAVTCWLGASVGSAVTKGLFIPASQLSVFVEKLKSQKQEQTANFLTGFWNTEKQVFEEMN
jgi:pyridoxal/pyridoxine/pyridoxamine kinase